MHYQNTLSDSTDTLGQRHTQVTSDALKKSISVCHADQGLQATD